jgi:hypothetical protein
MMPLSLGLSLDLTAIPCRPTIPPPSIFGFKFNSFAASTMPTELSGYEQTITRSAFSDVDCLTARVAGVPTVTIASTFSRTNSAAISL